MAKKCLEILKRCQHAEARLAYGFDWTREFSRRWVRDAPFGAGVTIRPEGEPTGFQYLSSGGQTGAEEPSWPRTVGGTVRDGSIVWTAEDISDTSLMEEIDTDAWTASTPSGLTVEPESPAINPGKQATSVVLSEGVAGQEYIVENEVTTTLQQEYVARIMLTIE